MATREEELYQERVAKLARLRERGIDPYPPRFQRTHESSEAIAAFEEWEPDAGEETLGPTVTVAGRVTALRMMGRANFLDLRDGAGRIQVFVRRDKVSLDDFQTLKDSDLGDFLGVTGPLFRTKAGEITVEAATITMLAKALQAPPEKWHGLADIEQRYRQRYRDLMANEETRRIFILRSKVVSAMRRFLDERGFMEVETPILGDHTGGAAARPFITHHNTLDQDMYLRIATELHLKRLIVGGYDRVYEIGKVFRNEGVSWKHNPEFTTLESYEAYTDYKSVMEMVEEMTAYVAEAATGSTLVNFEEHEIEFMPPWRRLTLRQALIDYADIDIERFSDEASLRQAMHDRHIETEAGAGWGKLVDLALKAKVEPALIQPTFIIDYPTEHSPLAKRKPDNEHYVERFEPSAGGLKFGNAYSELNDPLEQRERFETQLKLRAAGDDEAELEDEDFIAALEHGMPPTGGLGIGIDRLVMLLSGKRSIREVILFPTLRKRDE